MEVKDFLKMRRMELGLTLDDVARQVGVSASTISRWESGDINNMRRDRIARLAMALDVSPAMIMGWESQKKNGERVNDLHYMNPETADMAQEIFVNPELRALFKAARGSSAEDLKLAHDMLMALKRKEQHD